MAKEEISAFTLDTKLNRPEPRGAFGRPGMGGRVVQGLRIRNRVFEPPKSVISGVLHSRPKPPPQSFPKIFTDTPRHRVRDNRRQGAIYPTESVGVKLAPNYLLPFLVLACAVHQDELRVIVPRLLPDAFNSPGQEAEPVTRHPHIGCRDSESSFTVDPNRWVAVVKCPSETSMRDS